MSSAWQRSTIAFMGCWKLANVTPVDTATGAPTKKRSCSLDDVSDA
jgi:hypothetical protein